MAEKAGMMMFEVEIPRFCTIIQDDTIRIGKLMIPKEFAEEHGAELPNTVLLKLPNGSEWNVKVRRNGREILFHEGWREFAQFNSLALGHFLVFQYDSCGCFLVFIFGMSANEIDYKTKQGESAMTSDHTSGKQALKREYEKKKSLTDPQKARVISRASSSFKSDNPFFMLAMQPSFVATNPRINLPPNFFRENFKEKRREVILQVPDGKVWSVEYSVKEFGSREKATFSKSWNPFAQDNSLKVGDVCAFELVKDGTEPKFNVVIFRATDDLLDHCSSSHEVANRMIEMKPKKGSSSVERTVHATGNASKQLKHLNNDDQLLSIESSGVPEAANAFSSNRPFFRVSVQASHLSASQMVRFSTRICSLPVNASYTVDILTSSFPKMVGVQSIPMAFSNHHIKEAYDEAELWVSGKSWGVRIRKKFQKICKFRYYLGRGLSAFAVENSLKVGDVCIYELMKGEADDDDDSRRTMVLNVHIFRGQNIEASAAGTTAKSAAEIASARKVQSL
ncbi:B3 domain-containing protein At3g18960 [Linum perenne]